MNAVQLSANKLRFAGSNRQSISGSMVQPQMDRDCSRNVSNLDLVEPKRIRDWIYACIRLLTIAVNDDQGCSLSLERLGLEAVSRRFFGASLSRLGLETWKN